MTVTPVAADLAATSLPDFDGAIINNEYATKAGLSPDTIIAQDDPSSAGAEPYVNAFVARRADAKDPLLLKLAALYHTAAITDEVQRENGGSAVFETWSPAKLQQILAKVETDAKAAE